ncbi:acetyl-CoA carboxylase biotin carboxyl carrier protein [Embleya sp. NPDC055664]|uniref:acetyl-CoA carboxylase biotin carboxyl carrier protein n=1 Tax=Embleya sp. NPDC059237 TaxID=3346784 RepID=UPI0036B9301C
MTGADHQGPAATLAALHAALDRVLHDASRPPTHVVVRSGGESIELTWSAAVAPPPAPEAVPPAPVEAQREPAASEGHLVRAPLVGTFYAAPEPGAPPFVAVGDLVEAGQQVAIIEAMKLMNPIEADRAGRVTAVLVKNGDGVGYDEPLFELDCDGQG